jgi:hypothetical protein
MRSRFLSFVPLLFLFACDLFGQRLHRHPVVGGVTDSSATIAVWLAGSGSFRIDYALDSNCSGPLTTPPINSSEATGNMTMVGLDRLLPDARYYYRVTSPEGRIISPTFSFKTFPKPGTDAPVTILFGSSQQRTADESGSIFDSAEDLGGDLFIQLGDWAFPDRRIAGYPGSDSLVRESYALRLDTGYPFAARILTRMPLVYAWDEHDYNGDNGDNSYDTIPLSVHERLLAGYERFIPHYRLPNGSGIWQSFRIGNVEVFLIDPRSARSPVMEGFKGPFYAPPPGHSMLSGIPVPGTDQRTWLLDAIRRSTARWKILASPVFFNPANTPAIGLLTLAQRKDLAAEFADKWIGFPEDVDSLGALLKGGYGRNFAIISGDASTNLYDDGSHSIVPEFLVGNLGTQNSHLFDSLSRYGLDFWTAGEPGAGPTIGRLRVETSPRHKLIFESFDEKGAKVLSYEMIDGSQSVSSVPVGTDERTEVEARVLKDELLLTLTGSRQGRGIASIFDLLGRVVAEQMFEMEEGEITIALPASLAKGPYLGSLRIDERLVPFRFVRR